MKVTFVVDDSMITLNIKVNKRMEDLEKNGAQIHNASMSMNRSGMQTYYYVLIIYSE